MIDKNVEWQRERKMSAAQFRKIVGELYMTQAGAGRYLGVSERTARRYASGDTEVPPASALLLRSLVAFKVVPLVPAWSREGN